MDSFNRPGEQTSPRASEQMPPQYVPPQYQSPQYQVPQHQPGQHQPWQYQPGQMTPPPFAAPTPKNAPRGKAIAGMVLGICSTGAFPFSLIGFITAIIGLIFSIIGLREAKKNPVREGRGMAIAGLVCSIIGLILGILFLLFMFLLIAESMSYSIFGHDYYNYAMRAVTLL